MAVEKINIVEDIRNTSGEPSVFDEVMFIGDGALAIHGSTDLEFTSLYSDMTRINKPDIDILGDDGANGGFGENGKDAPETVVNITIGLLKSDIRIRAKGGTGGKGGNSSDKLPGSGGTGGSSPKVTVTVKDVAPITKETNGEVSYPVIIFTKPDGSDQEIGCSPVTYPGNGGAPGVITVDLHGEVGEFLGNVKVDMPEPKPDIECECDFSAVFTSKTQIGKGKLTIKAVCRFVSKVPIYGASVKLTASKANENGAPDTDCTFNPSKDNVVISKLTYIGNKSDFEGKCYNVTAEVTANPQHQPVLSDENDTFENSADFMKLKNGEKIIRKYAYRKTFTAFNLPVTFVPPNEPEITDYAKQSFSSHVFTESEKLAIADEFLLLKEQHDSVNLVN
jgi:hypothetical protein